MAIVNTFIDPLPSSPMILANNLAIGAIVSATSDAQGFPASAVTNPLTYERWAPATAGSHAITIDVPSKIDTIAIAAHTLGTEGASFVISVFFTDVAEWFDVYSDTATSDEPIVLPLFAPVTTVSQVRITIDKQAEIGVIYIGERLLMPLTIYGGHTPDTLGRTVEFTTAESVTGNFLGRTVERSGYEVSYSFKYLGAAWYRQHFDKFARDAIRNPFFIAWYPSRYPKEVVYGWTDKPIVPNNSGLKDYLDVTFTVKAICHE